jgi:hypothetical protein
MAKPTPRTASSTDLTPCSFSRISPPLGLPVCPRGLREQDPSRDPPGRAQIG